MKSVIRGRLQIAGTVVVIDQDRMNKALAEKKINMPIGLTREQKRQFILEASKRDADNSSK
jgi:hypothetical protein